jgi:hypothetical protein
MAEKRFSIHDEDRSKIQLESIPIFVTVSSFFTYYILTKYIPIRLGLVKARRVTVLERTTIFAETVAYQKRKRSI